MRCLYMVAVVLTLGPTFCQSADTSDKLANLSSPRNDLIQMEAADDPGGYEALTSAKVKKARKLTPQKTSKDDDCEIDETRMQKNAKVVQGQRSSDSKSLIRNKTPKSKSAKTTGCLKAKAVNTKNSKNKTIKEKLPGKSNSSKSKPSVQDRCLTLHNYLRGLHDKIDSLKWNVTLERSAQIWANTLVRDGNIKHSSYVPGENIFWEWLTDKSPTDAIDKALFAWYNEWKDYGAKGGGNDGMYAAAHFTQVVWRSSKTVACAEARNFFNGQYWVIVVAQYYPSGNWIGTVPKNVTPTKKYAKIPKTVEELSKVKTSL